MIKIFPFPTQGLWIFFTILILIGGPTPLGPVIYRSYLWFISTFLGAIIALLIVLIFKNNTWLEHTVLICLTVLLFSCLSAGESIVKEMAPLGSVTALVILLSSPNNNFYITAIMRFAEINIGIIISLLVSTFIWPVHAKAQLISQIRNTLQFIKDSFDQIPFSAEPTPHIFRYKIIKKFEKSLHLQRDLAHAISQETFRKKKQSEDYKKLINCQYEISVSFFTLFSAVEDMPITFRAQLKNNLIIHQIYQTCAERITDTILELQGKISGQTPPSQDTLSEGWKQELMDQLHPGNSFSYNMRFHVFIFGLEFLLKKCQEMRILSSSLIN